MTRRSSQKTILKKSIRDHLHQKDIKEETQEAHLQEEDIQDPHHQKDIKEETPEVQEEKDQDRHHQKDTKEETQEVHLQEEDIQGLLPLKDTKKEIIQEVVQMIQKIQGHKELNIFLSSSVCPINTIF
jgi:hypothetical protein